MKTRKIDYSNGKTKFVGYLAVDDTTSTPRPGVIVFPEAFGLNDHARQRADRLAQLGYVALAADIIGDGQVIEDMATLGPIMQSLFADRLEWRSRTKAAFDTLLAQPQTDKQRVAAIGFCFGGTTALELARTGAALKAVTTFHAGLIPEMPGDAGRVQAKVLVCHGAEDPLIKDEALKTVTAEFRRDQLDWQLTYYGNAVHSFTDPEADKRGSPAFGYSRSAEQRSWAAMRYLFDEVFTWTHQ
jgi:dienelactone hydrolase